MKNTTKKTTKQRKKSKSSSESGGFEKLQVSINGKPTLLCVGDHIKFHEKDTMRCITKISIDSDGCVSYLMTYIDNDHTLCSQWFTENDFNIMASLEEPDTVIGFHQ